MVDPPATDMETHVLERISCILQRPRWWVAWQEDTSFRRRWLSEHEGRWLLQRFAQTDVRVDEDERQLYVRLGSILAVRGAQDGGNLKIARLEHWLSGLVTQLKPPSEYLDADSDESEDESEDEDEEAKEEKGDVAADPEDAAVAELKRLEKRVARRDSYVHVKWALNQLLLLEKLRARPVRCWTRSHVLPAIQAAQLRSDASLSARCASFVLAVAREGVDVGTALRLPALSSLRLEREHVQMLQLHCQRLRRDVAAAQRYIERALDTIVQSEGLSIGVRGDTDESRVVISPAGIDGAWVSDNLLPKPLVTAFLSQIARLEREREREQQTECHGNVPQRLGLVDPSMFCCKLSKTLRASTDASNALDAASPAEYTARLMFAGSEQIKRPPYVTSTYRWIPTDFQVSPDLDENGELQVRALSYINNVHPERHAGLTESIAAIVSRFVPLFERVLSFQAQGQEPLDLFEQDDENPCKWEVPPLRPGYPETLTFPTNGEPSVSLRGSRLQIHVKVTEVVLTPETPSFPGGEWHYEGDYNSDGVVVCGVYCFSSENVRPSAGSAWLAFRSSSGLDWFRAKEYDLHTRGIHGDGVSNPLEGRCFAYSSYFQHRELPFELTDPSKPGVRKFLSLLLVEAESELPSTSVVPPQQQHWLKNALEPPLKRLKLVDAAEHIVREFLSPGGMTLEDAARRRAHVIQERSRSCTARNVSWQPRGFLW